MSSGDYSHKKLPRHEVMRVAAVAMVDTRCVVRYLRRVHDGDDVPIKPSTIAHVERALRKCGFVRLIDPESYAAAPKEPSQRPPK